MFKTVEVAVFVTRAIRAMMLAAIAIGIPATSKAIEREIAWTEDYESAIQRAASTNSVILLHFYGDYCPPCKLLDKKTFHDPALVSSMNEHLVTIKVNADRRRDLARTYQVTRWPTDVYLFPNGDEIYRGVSNADPSVYCKTIERVCLRHRDWTVERNATAKAKERRQDRELAAHTPQIRQEPQLNSGSSGRAVRTHDASWANSGVQPQPVHSNSRVVENPYIVDRPIVVPPATLVDRVASTDGASLAAPIVNLVPSNEIAKQEQSQSPRPNQSAASQPVYAESIGMGGFCPVTLNESLSQPNMKAWVEGRKSCAVRHRGRIYYCASERSRQTLLNDPDRYTPCLSGFDIVQLCKEGELRDGKCEFGFFQEGTNRIFLFKNKANYDAFAQDSVYYSRLLENSEPERVANESSGTQIR